MKQPSFISWCEEQFDKPVSNFTKADWEVVAIAAAEIIEEKDEEFARLCMHLERAGDLLERHVPVPKRRGRPKKPAPRNRLAYYHSRYGKLLKKKGRPPAKYGKLKCSVEQLSCRMSLLRSSEPGRSEAQVETMRKILQKIGHPTCYAPSALRAVRRFREGQKSQKK
jgi:hypothetical protein